MYKKTIKSLNDIYRKIESKLPVRLTSFILLSSVIFIIGYSKKITDYTAFSDIFSLLLKIIVFVVLMIFTFSMLSSLYAYLRYKSLIKSKRISPEITFFRTTDDSDGKIRCKAVIQNALRPLGVSASVALNFRNYTAPEYRLGYFREKKTGIKGLKGNFTITPPEIGNYDLKSVSIRFRDIFKLFSLRITQKASGKCTTIPSADRFEIGEIFPVRSREEIKRTNIVRRQPGEWLKFKNFEPADDIRRIVWQIYARNKELIIRSQELHNMYSSRIDIYASFYNSLFGDPAANKLNSLFLNAYKNKIWSVIKTFEDNNDLEIRFVPDQVFAETSSPDLSETLSGLAAMNWHEDLKPSDYHRQGDVSVLCITSLIPAEELLAMLRTGISGTLIMFVPVSEINNASLSNMIKEIFTVPDNENGFGVWKWLVSPYRLRLRKNEVRIKELLAEHGVNFVEI